MTRVWFNKTFSSIHSALTLIRDGDAEGAYRLVCSNPDPRALGLLAADEAASEPKGVTGEQYVEWCLEFSKVQGIDIFVPGKEASLIARHRARFLAQGVRVMSAAAPEALDLLHDKALFYAAANAPTAPSPEFEEFDTWPTFEEVYRKLRMRHPALCMKPAVSVYGIGFRVIVEDKAPFDLLLDGNPYRIELHSLLHTLERKGDFVPMLLMPFLSGHEYSVDCVAADGELVCAVARRKSLSGRGQTIVVREDINAACGHFIAQFGLNGNVNIQFREGSEGLRVLEINPRMSGGIGMACLAGPNLPYIGLVTFDRGRGAMSVPPVEDGVRVIETNRAVRLP